jgi:hypothetical protein
VTKFALPALILCVFGLFWYSITSRSNNLPLEVTEERAEPTQKPANAETAPPDREQSSVNNIETVRTELQRLSENAKANSEKIAQTAALRSDVLKLLQDSKSSSERATQMIVDEVNALRADQTNLVKDAKEAGDKAAQSLREEVAASQAKFVAQVGDLLTANTARADALSQRIDAIKNDVDDMKKNFDQDRLNTSNISPGIALFAALAALVFGPFVAYQFAANKIASLKRQENPATAQPSRVVRAEAEAEPALRRTDETLPEAYPSHEAPALSEDANPHDDVNAHQSAEPDPEKV